MEISDDDDCGLFFWTRGVYDLLLSTSTKHNRTDRRPCFKIQPESERMQCTQMIIAIVEAKRAEVPDLQRFLIGTMPC